MQNLINDFGGFATGTADWVTDLDFGENGYDLAKGPNDGSFADPEDRDFIPIEEIGHMDFDEEDDDQFNPYTDSDEFDEEDDDQFDSAGDYASDFIDYFAAAMSEAEGAGEFGRGEQYHCSRGIRRCIEIQIRGGMDLRMYRGRHGSGRSFRPDRTRRNTLRNEGRWVKEITRRRARVNGGLKRADHT